MLSETDFAVLASEILTRTGAVIGRETNALVETRLSPIARREGFGAVSEMIQSAKIKADGKLWVAMAEAVVQTDTRFFRDRALFARLQNEILPAMAARKAGGLIRIWSAGCGSGQEAFSLAMMLDELRSEGGFAAELTATDMSERLLEKARSGLFTQFEIQRGLPIRKLIAHFERAGDLWRISDRLRAGVRFTAHNLLSAPPTGPFDLIFCCNVLTHFDATARRAALTRIAEALAPEGMLILAQGEKVDGLDTLTHVGGVFVKSGARRAA